MRHWEWAQPAKKLNLRSPAPNQRQEAHSIYQGSTWESLFTICSGLSPLTQVFSSSLIFCSMGGIDQREHGCLYRKRTALAVRLVCLLGTVLATKKSLSPSACNGWVPERPYSDRVDGHDSSMSKVHIALDSMQPEILLDSSLQPLEHPRADTGKEDWEDGYSPRQAKGWPCNGPDLRWVGKGANHCVAVHHKHSVVQSCPHSHLHMLHPASKWVAARAAELPTLAGASTHDCGASPQEYTLVFGWTSWLGAVTHCHLGSPVLFGIQRASIYAYYCVLVLPVFWVPCQLLALPPLKGLVAENWLAPGPMPGEDQLCNPSHSSSLCKALFTLAWLLKKNA